MYIDQRSGQFVYSPSDLIRFLESPYSAWMDRLHLACPGRFTCDQASEELALVREAGNQHERRFLESLQRSGRTVVSIDRGHEALKKTRQAIEAGCDIIYQAYLATSPFAGYADFLVRSQEAPDLYEVWDTKLARTPKPYFLLQLCCYSDLLEGLTGRRPEKVCVVLGTNETRQFRTDDYFFYYREVRDAFLELMAGFDPDAAPPDPDPRADHGRWQSAAEALLVDCDHLVQVAGITTGQIRRLRDAGIHTVEQLAASSRRQVPRLESKVLDRLRDQAVQQVQTRNRQRESGEKETVVPSYALRQPDPANPRTGLALLPPPSPGDVYFDLEGYPLVEGGLEYLWGAVTVEQGQPVFHDWWAHSRRDERQAFEDFVDWLTERRRQYPDLHVFHYAPYETATLKRLMGRDATREEEVDGFLRENVFVDLYRVVQQGVCLGAPNYSLKTVERLYRSARSGDVANAGASIVAYGQWRESGESPDWKTSLLLRQIRDYNEDDCVSTWQLSRWLWDRQQEAGLTYLPPSKDLSEESESDSEDPDRPTSGNRRRAARAQSLLAEISTDPAVRAAQSTKWEIQELLAHFLEFHRREDKPKWWARFDWHLSTEDQLIADSSCLGGLVRTKASPVKVKQSLEFEYRFDPSQETKLSSDDRAIVAHDLSLAVTLRDLQAAGTVRLAISQRKLADLPGRSLPERLSLLPDEFLTAKELQESIERLADRWQSSGTIPSAFEQFLLGQPPRLKQRQRGELLRAGETPCEGAVRLVRDLKSGTLCIQGPPGAGKTYTAASMIQALLADGRRVGITSNSHKAILNLMVACQERSSEELVGLKVGGDAQDPLLQRCPGIEYVASGKDAAAKYREGLIGGTAWLFARSEMQDRVDFLFVDEAGQVSLANLAAMCGSTTNIVLMGDQMQLSQPIQGTHPGRSGESLLEYYLKGHAVVPPELGVFLGESWRMHPGVCGFVSGSVYEGRLGSHASTARRVLLPGAAPARYLHRDAGLIYCGVPHTGNSQCSEEEADRIVEIVNELLEREHCNRDGQSCGRLTLNDILFVAPYNKQVRLLKERLPEGAQVASVDKFQGQEAPVVILSMCSSTGDFGPRGLEFVLSQNRLNVAISRAQSLAIVVGDPAIGRSVPGNLPDMQRLNLFCRIMAEGRPVSGSR